MKLNYIIKRIIVHFDFNHMLFIIASNYFQLNVLKLISINNLRIVNIYLENSQY